MKIWERAYTAWRRFVIKESTRCGCCEGPLAPPDVDAVVPRTRYCDDHCAIVAARIDRHAPAEV